MQAVRIMPVGAHRIGNACLSLHFDHNLPEFDQTIIVSPLDSSRLDSIFQKYNVNTSKFVYYRDQDIIDLYPQILHWNLTGDTRQGWLQQQALKLACVDLVDADQILLQDAESFCIKSYQPFINGELNFFYLPNVSHSNGYYEAFRNATGIHRQTPHCFVCDILPVSKQSWVDLKQLLQQKFSAHWLDTLINATPWDHVQNLKWFSEYEFLANWHISRNRYYQMTQQNRYEIKSLDQLTHHQWPAEANFISEKNPQGSLLRFDFANDTVLYYDQVCEHLSNMLNRSFV